MFSVLFRLSKLTRPGGGWGGKTKVGVGGIWAEGPQRQQTGNETRRNNKTTTKPEAFPQLTGSPKSKSHLCKFKELNQYSFDFTAHD